MDAELNESLKKVFTYIKKDKIIEKFGEKWGSLDEEQIDKLKNEEELTDKDYFAFLYLTTNDRNKKLNESWRGYEDSEIKERLSAILELHEKLLDRYLRKIKKVKTYEDLKKFSETHLRGGEKVTDLGDLRHLFANIESTYSTKTVLGESYLEKIYKGFGEMLGHVEKISENFEFTGNPVIIENKEDKIEEIKKKLRGFSKPTRRTSRRE